MTLKPPQRRDSWRRDSKDMEVQRSVTVRSMDSQITTITKLSASPSTISERDPAPKNGVRQSFWHNIQMPFHTRSSAHGLDPLEYGENHQPGLWADTSDMVKEKDKMRKHHIFQDVQEMKQQIKKRLYKRKYNVADFYYETGIFQKMARSNWFEQVGLLVIAGNALWIAIDTDYNNSEVLVDADWGFQFAENLFCTFFSWEWLVRFMAFRYKRSCLRDFWFVFDSMLVSLMVVETWVMTILFRITGSGAGAGVGNASILRLVRLLRLTRVARMARLLRAVPELMILIKGMVAATRSVFFTLCLLLSLMYVWGIAFVQLTADVESDRRIKTQKYFKSVPDAMLTLLLRGTYLDECTEIVNDLLDEHVALVFLFLVFVLLASSTVLNMLIGVLCEVVSVVAAAEKEEMTMSFVVMKLGAILDELDVDGNSEISRKEFLEMLKNEDAVMVLNEVGVDAIALVDFADVIFSNDDGEEAEEKPLSFEDFMEIVMQFRGSNTATVKDVVYSQKALRATMMSMSKNVKELGMRFEQWERSTHEIPEATTSTAVVDSSTLSVPICRGTLRSPRPFTSSRRLQPISRPGPGRRMTAAVEVERRESCDGSATEVVESSNAVQGDSTSVSKSLNSEDEVAQALRRLISHQISLETSKRIAAENIAEKLRLHVASLEQENRQLRGISGGAATSETHDRSLSSIYSNTLQIPSQTSRLDDTHAPANVIKKLDSPSNDALEFFHQTISVERNERSSRRPDTAPPGRSLRQVANGFEPPPSNGVARGAPFFDRRLLSEKGTRPEIAEASILDGHAVREPLGHPHTPTESPSRPQPPPPEDLPPKLDLETRHSRNSSGNSYVFT